MFCASRVLAVRCVVVVVGTQVGWTDKFVCGTSVNGQVACISKFCDAHNFPVVLPTPWSFPCVVSLSLVFVVSTLAM